MEAPADFAGIETLTFAVADPTGAATAFDLLVFAAPLSGAPLLAPLPGIRLPVDGVDASLDLDDYVTDKTLDGLFTVIGEQEQSIRQNPAARTTDLLKKVFGGG